MHMSLGWIAYLPIPGLFLVPWLAQPRDRNARFHAWQGGLLVGLLWVVLILLGLLGRASDASGFQLFIGAVTLIVLIAYFIGALVGALAAGRDRFVRIRPVYDILALRR